MKAGNELILYSLERDLGLKISDKRAFGVYRNQIVLIDNVDGMSAFQVSFLLKDAVIVPDELISKFKKENRFKGYRVQRLVFRKQESKSTVKCLTLWICLKDSL